MILKAVFKTISDNTLRKIPTKRTRLNS